MQINYKWIILNDDNQSGFEELDFLKKALLKSSGFKNGYIAIMCIIFNDYITLNYTDTQFTVVVT